MGQSIINTQRLTWLDRFRPSESVDSVLDIDLAALRSVGVDALMLDLDNTLLPWKSSEVSGDVKEWIGRAKSEGMKLCIVSNTHNPRRLAKIAAELDIACLDRALKPRGSGFARASALIGSQPAKTVVVGDQLLTDILGGNLAGMRTVLVKPMHHREFFGTKISRLIEKGIFALLSRSARPGTNSRPTQSETQDTR